MCPLPVIVNREIVSMFAFLIRRKRFAEEAKGIATGRANCAPSRT
jgi:hypothetical protein